MEVLERINNYLEELIDVREEAEFYASAIEDQKDIIAGIGDEYLSGTEEVMPMWMQDALEEERQRLADFKFELEVRNYAIDDLEEIINELLSEHVGAFPDSVTDVGMSGELEWTQMDVDVDTEIVEVE